MLACEGRSYVASVSGLLRASDVPKDFPGRELWIQDEAAILMNGGSCVAAPDGTWSIEPVIDREALLTCELDIKRVLEERQNFDPAGH